MGTLAVAALIVAVLLADKLATPTELRRRFYQVGLGVATVLLTTAVAALLVPVPEDLAQSLSLGDLDDEGGHIFKERLSIVAAGGFFFLLVGLYQARNLPTVSMGVLLGALVLLISAVADSRTGSFLNYYYDLTLDAGPARNAAYAAIIAIGMLMLLLYGYNEWDRWAKTPQEVEAEEA